MSIIDNLDSNKNNESIALEEENIQVTYKNLYLTVQLYSNRIKNLNMNSQNVAIVLPNSMEYVMWYYAIIQSGNVIVPIYYNSSISEINNIIKSCDISVLITNDLKFKLINTTDIDQNLDIIINDSDRIVNINNEKDKAISLAHPSTILMLSTSGSFNSPKRVMLSDYNLLTNALGIIDSLKYDKNDVFLVILPLCLASANTSQMLVSLVLGAKLVIFKDILHPRNISKAIFEKSITSTTVVPSVFKMLVESKHFYISLMPTLKTICFGGGPSSMSIIEAAYVKFTDINLVHMYGQTEASARLTHFTNTHSRDKIGSVGKPLANINIKIVDENLQSIDAGHEGEIAVKGENVMLGYYKQPGETHKVLVDNWLLTGDIGKVDEDGYLYITGRKKNIIIYSGMNIYPEEIENIIFKNKKIMDVIVYGIKNDQFGEIIAADVVVKEGEIINAKELQQYCLNLLPLHKVPELINIVDQLKRTVNGKLLRKIN